MVSEKQGYLEGTAKRPARRLSPADKAGKLVALCRANPTLWPTIQRDAKEQADEHGFVSVSAIFAQQRWAGLVNPDASPYRLNNDFAPIFSRMLAAKYPNLAPLIELRRSGFDALDIALVLQLIEAPDGEPGQ